jgi:hypothetical protein
MNIFYQNNRMRTLIESNIASYPAFRKGNRAQYRLAAGVDFRAFLR